MASHVKTTIRYDGPALAHHEMDVQDLAPALLALAEIVQIANRKFNGDSASMRVLVNADVEQKCFQIDLSLVQSVLDQARGLFTPDNVKTAQDIAKIIGIVGSGSVGLFKFVKWMTQKKGDNPTTFSVKAQTGSTVLVVHGDGNTITVPKEVYELGTKAVVLEKVKGVVRPLTKPGYDSLEFFEGDKPVERLTSNDASAIVAMPPSPVAPPSEDVSVIVGVVRIKAPQYEGNAKWSVLWGGRAIDVTIPADWVRQFQANAIHAPPGTTLMVEMEQRTALDDKGNAVGAPTYVVTNVMSVIPPPQQTDLLDPKSRG